MAQIITNNTKIRYSKPHPIDFKELKAPLMRVGSKLDRSIPYMVRIAVKQWLETNHPEALKD